MDAADFDGTNDNLRRLTAFTGATTATRKALFSCWVYIDQNPPTSSPAFGSYQLALATADLGNGPFNMGLAVTNNDPSAGGTISFTCNEVLGVDTQFGFSYPATFASWIHILTSFNTATGQKWVFINGVDVTASASPFLNNVGNADWTASPLFNVGGFDDHNGNFFNPADCGLAELWFDPNQFLDLSVGSNVSKFISGGKPVNLGSDGSTPTGTKPMIYLHLDDGETANNFATNRTGNGDLTVNRGALTTKASSPSD